MPWLLVFHIAALLCWCGALLYLPGLLVACYTPPKGQAKGQSNPLLHSTHTPPHVRLPRVVYSWVATPAALAAIIAGTLVFYRYRILDVWLIIKLMLVTLLVGLHLLAGLLVVLTERGKLPHLKFCGYLTTLLLTATMTAIVWLVLAKPGQGS